VRMEFHRVRVALVVLQEHMRHARACLEGRGSGPGESRIAALRTGGAALFWTPLVSGADLLEVGRAEMRGLGDD
jgi:hypothetical protein